MAAINRNPQSSNYLQPTKFQVNFPRISTVTYFCQEINIPGVSSNAMIQTNPFIDLPRPGDKMVYGAFDIEFIVDEDLWSWQIIHDWLRGYTFPCSFDEYKNLDRTSLMSLHAQQPQYCDGQLTILNALNNPKLKVKFFNAFPVELSPIKFSTTSSADTIITASASFRFHLFNIER